MEINKEKEEVIINFGVFGYSSISKMANILNIDIIELKKEFDKKESKFHQLYNKGVDMADYVIDLKLFELAKSGDLKALDKLETRKRLRK